MAESIEKKVFNIVCKAFESKGWKYSKDESKLQVKTSFSGDDLSMPITITVDADRELVRMFSILPFNFREDKRPDGAFATTLINWVLVNGSFDYDLSDGQTAYRMVNSFAGGCLPSEEIIQYMVRCIVHTVDEYNDKLQDINDNRMTIKQLIEELRN